MNQYESIHDIQTQKRIHDLVYRLIQELDLRILKAPRIDYTAPPNEYECEEIYEDLPIFLGDRMHGTELAPMFYEEVCNELIILWWALWEKGFAACDFDLYLQPNDTVMLTGYSTFGFRMTSGPVSILLPQFQEDPEKSKSRLRYFFEPSCFPRDFVRRLYLLNRFPPADCLPV
jgi:hypothetical protein